MNTLAKFIYSCLDSTTYFKVKFIDDITTKIPSKSDPGCAGYDICSGEFVFVPKNSRKLISTGLCVEIPSYYYLRVAPRSSMAVKGIDVGAGVIDSSYRGEVKILLINTTDEDYIINKGDKIAQLIMERCSNAKVVLTDTLTETERGLKGFGSSGR